MKLINEKDLVLNTNLHVETYEDDNGKRVNSFRIVVKIPAGFMTIDSPLIIPKDKKELKQYLEYLANHEESTEDKSKERK